MIKIECMNYKDYVICLLAIAGVCEKSFLLRTLKEMEGSKSDWYARKVLRELTADKSIKESKIMTNKKIIRLAKKGHDSISQIPQLKNHYDLITSNNHLRINDAGAIERNIQLAEIIVILNNNDCLINRINVKYIKREKYKEAWHQKYGVEMKDYYELTEGEKQYNPVPGVPTRCSLHSTIITCETTNDILDNKTIQGNIDINYVNFIPDCMLKEGDKSFNNSIARGCILGKDIIYTVFYMNSKCYRLSGTREFMFAKHVLSQYAEKFGDEYISRLATDMNKEGSAIIFVNDDGVQKLLEGDFIDNKEFLTFAFSHTYVIPSTSRRISQFLNPSMKRIICNDIYFDVDENRRKEFMQKTSLLVDGFIKDINEERDGFTYYPSYELYTLDLNKLVEIREAIEYMPLRILCSKKNEQAIRDYLFESVYSRVAIKYHELSKEERIYWTKVEMSRNIIGTKFWPD